MKFKASALAIITLALAGCDEVSEELKVAREVSGTIAENATWKASECPVLVTDDVYVEGPKAPVLTIEAGCEVRFAANRGLYVSYHSEPGALKAVGTADKPIVFTSDGAKQPGAWAGLSFAAQTVAASSELTFVTVEYAGGEYLDGGVVVAKAAVLVKDSASKNNTGTGFLFTQNGGFAAGSARVTATGNSEYGVSLAASEAAGVPEDGSYAGNTAGAVEVAGGTVAASGTWGALDGAYHLTDDVYVESASAPVLTLAAGTVLKFGANCGLYVSYHSQPGALRAEGVAGKQVLFTSAGAAQAGAWSGVSLANASVDAQNSLVETKIEYAGGEHLEGCLVLNDAKAAVNNVTISNCDGFGLQLQNKAALADAATGLTISNTTTGAAEVDAAAAHTIPSAASSYTGNTGGIAVEIRGGTVATSATWKALDGPYFVSGDIYVEGDQGSKLTIEAGARLEFGANKGLYVSYNSDPGALWAVGEAAKRIVFTVHGSPYRGAWAGISFATQTTDVDSKLEYVDVRYAGGEDLPGAVKCQDAKPTFSNLDVSDSGKCGIWVHCSSGALPSGLATVTYANNDTSACDCSGLDFCNNDNSCQ